MSKNVAKLRGHVAKFQWHVTKIKSLELADDQNDVVIFLITLDELMSAVALQYQFLNKQIKSNRGIVMPSLLWLGIFWRQQWQQNLLFNKFNNLKWSCKLSIHIWQCLVECFQPWLCLRLLPIFMIYWQSMQAETANGRIKTLSHFLETVWSVSLLAHIVNGTNGIQLYKTFALTMEWIYTDKLEHVVILKVPLKCELRTSVKGIQTIFARIGQPCPQSHT